MVCRSTWASNAMPKSSKKEVIEIYANARTFMCMHSTVRLWWIHNNQTKRNWFFVLGNRSNASTFRTFFVCRHTRYTDILWICQWHAKPNRVSKSNVLHTHTHTHLTCRVFATRRWPFQQADPRIRCVLCDFSSALCLFSWTIHNFTCIALRSMVL